MNRTFMLLLICIFLTAFGLDRISKSYFLENFLQWSTFGPFFFEKHLNPGFVLQILSESSVMARVVFVSSLYGFLFFGFFLLQAVLPNKLSALRIGLTLFFASITGNGYDRAFSGAVTDFICFRLGERIVYFNIADVFMWVGFGLILFSIYHLEHKIWHPDSKRKKYLVDQSYQYRWALQTSLIALSSTLILILFSYSFMVYGAPHINSSDGLAYLLSAGSLGVLFSAIIFYSGVLFSHRSAGPVYAFERFVEKLLKGEEVTFTLRKTDDHQHLVAMAERLKEEFKILPKGETKVKL